MNSSSKPHLRFVVMLLSILAHTLTGLAHDAPVHGSAPDNLTDKAATASGVSLASDDIRFMKKGACDEDRVLADPLNGDMVRYRGHFYNPHTLSASSFGGKLAVDLAASRWQDMKTAFTYPARRWSGDSADGVQGSFHALGRALHLLQDMASPPHVNGPNGHGWPTVNGPEHSGGPGCFSDFESVWSMADPLYQNWPFPSVSPEPLSPDLAATTSFSSRANWNSKLDRDSWDEMASKLAGISASERHSIVGYLRSLAWATYYHTTFFGQINKSSSSPAPPTSSDGRANILAQMFPGRVSFYGSFLDDYWTIDGVGYYEKKFTYFEDDWWPAPGAYPAGNSQDASGNIKGRFYIYEQHYRVEGSYAATFYVATPPSYWPDGTENAGDSLAKYYGKVLLPLASRFGAGVIRELFPSVPSISYPSTSSDGQIDVIWGEVRPTDAGGLSAYRLERSDNGGPWRTVCVSPHKSFTELVDNGTYRYRVSAQWFSSSPIYGAPTLGPDVVVHKALLQVETPAISPAGGTFESSASVSLSCKTAGATIRYTLDGSTPTATSTAYSAPVVVSASRTLKARAFKDGYDPSAVASATFTITAPPLPKVATPSLSPPGGTFNGYALVTMQCPTLAATIHYTTDGSSPTLVSPMYWGPLLLTAPTTVRACAYLLFYTDSDEVSGTYDVTPSKVSPPEIAMVGTNRPGEAVVTIKCTTFGATIHYTQDGTRPSATSPVYVTPLILTNSATITAYGSLVGYVDSDPSSATFTLSAAKVALPSISPNGGTVTNVTPVFLGCDTFGAIIHYTMDGTEPGVSSPLYVLPIVLTSSCTVKAKAFFVGFEDSDMASASFTCESPQVDTPTVEPGEGNYTNSVTVVCGCSTVGAILRYTTDGSEPGTNSCLYLWPLILTNSTTVKVKGFLYSYGDSECRSARYTIIQKGVTELVSGLVCTSSTNGLGVAWNGIPGRAYQVLYKDDLLEPVWKPASGLITAPSAALEWKDPGLPGSTRRFYIIRTGP